MQGELLACHRKTRNSSEDVGTDLSDGLYWYCLLARTLDHISIARTGFWAEPNKLDGRLGAAGRFTRCGSHTRIAYCNTRWRVDLASPVLFRFTDGPVMLAFPLSHSR